MMMRTTSGLANPHRMTAGVRPCESFLMARVRRSASRCSPFVSTLTRNHNCIFLTARTCLIRATAHAGDVKVRTRERETTPLTRTPQGQGEMPRFAENGRKGLDHGVFSHVSTANAAKTRRNRRLSTANTAERQAMTHYAPLRSSAPPTASTLMLVASEASLHSISILRRLAICAAIITCAWTDACSHCVCSSCSRASSSILRRLSRRRARLASAESRTACSTMRRHAPRNGPG